MNDKNKTLEPLPDFKTVVEETEFWKTHNIFDYATQDSINSYKLKYDDGVMDVLVEGQDADNPKLTEMVNVRFDFNTVNVLKQMAMQEDRPVGSLIRRWVVQRMKEEKYNSQR